MDLSSCSNHLNSVLVTQYFLTEYAKKNCHFKSSWRTRIRLSVTISFVIYLQSTYIKSRLHTPNKLSWTSYLIPPEFIRRRRTAHDVIMIVIISGQLVVNFQRRRGIIVRFILLLSLMWHVTEMSTTRRSRKQRVIVTAAA